MALAQVEPADAADASGVMTTAAQIAQVLGVAAYGSVYLGAADGQPPGSSAHAIFVTALLVTFGVLVGALAASMLPRQQQTA